jgi:NADPH:quinone reductase-like Zn-dependent oxidoreductase
MEPLRDELLGALGSIEPRSASVPMLSTVTARYLDGPACDADYWIRNIRDPVLFLEAIGALAREGHDVFLEVSAHPVLTGAIGDGLRHAGRHGVALPSLRRGEDGRAALLGSLGQLYTLGYPVDWSRLHGSRGRVVPLPSYPWQRERFWLDPAITIAGVRDGRAGKRLLGQGLASSVHVGAYFWERELSLRAFPYLADHCVQQLPVFPAAAYLEMALAAAGDAFGPGPHELERMSFDKALFLSADEPRTLQLVATARMGGATLQFLSRETSATGSNATWTQHAAGGIRFGDPSRSAAPPAQESVATIQGRCPETITGPDFYRGIQARGLQYGPIFQGVERLWRRDGEALGRVGASAEVESGARGYRIHPALLDACLQVVAAALPRGESEDGQVYLPVRVERMRLHGSPGAALWSHAVIRSAGPSRPDTIETDVTVLDDAGQVVLEVQGLALQRLEPQGSAATEATRDWLYEVAWIEKALAVPASSPDPVPADHDGRWLIFADAHGVAPALRNLLEARGERCVLLSRTQDVREFLTEAFGPHQPAWRGIVHLWSLDAATADETTPATLAEARETGCISVLQIVQGLGEAGRGEAPRLWLVTRNTQAVGEPVGGLSIAQAPLWGLGKTIALEHPELRCTRIDLGPAADADEAHALFQELWLNDGEDEVAFRTGRRYVPRLRHLALEPAEATPVMVSSDTPFRLEVPAVGILDNFVLRSTRRRAPGPGEVEIRVRALGLNFRDVLIALGLVPPVFKGSLDFGWECAGTVVAVGEGVRDFQVGDEVLAVALGCFGSYATTPAAAVTPKPAHLNFDEAATIPIVFMTAYYALHHLARLQPKERVLIHAAAGGVGLAAVQIARHIGAEVFATAGSPEKRDFLRSLGVAHVMDSRSLDFAGAVMERTAGQGVDVVLNSLAGEFIPTSVSTLAPGGRFLEIGKVDVLKNTPLGLGLLEKNIAFFVVDLAYIFLNRPDIGRTVLGEVIQHVQTGAFKPLPFRVFPVSQAVDAFRHLAQARHIGKVVVSLQEPEVAVLAAPDAGSPVRPDATYLITGGFGGLGLAVAKRLAAQGARHLVLMGRGGPSSAEAKDALETLKHDGVQVAVAHGDVARRTDVARILNGIREHMPPLRGIVHAAGVLDDGILLQQDRDRFARVMAPKVDGAWALHSLTTDDPLDFFVLFSSGASVLGSPGQGNYVAANAFLDALAHHRRAQGQPAVAINWGAWGEVGLAARADRGANLAGRGLLAMAPPEALQLFDHILRHRPAQVTAARVDWARVGSVHTPPLLQEIVGGASAGASEAATDEQRSPRETVLAAPADRRRELLQELIVNELARVLRCAPSRIDVDQPLTRLGLDSLMAVEFRNRIESGLSVRLPVAELLKGPTTVSLAARLAEELGRAASPAPAITAQPARELLAKLDQLSDEEVDALLRARQEGHTPPPTKAD